MRAKQWLVGCVLCIAGLGSAAASSLDSQDLDNSSRAASDSSSPHDDAGADFGNPLLSNRGASTGGSDSASDTSTHRSGGTTTPAHNRPSQLGWQSLLPGSIQ